MKYMRLQKPHKWKMYNSITYHKANTSVTTNQA